MMYRLVLTVLGACLIAGGVGCEKRQTVALDDPLTPAQTTTVERRGGLLPWEWGNDREVEEVEVEVEYAEEDDRKGPLESLAFWNWGDDEPDPITTDDVLGNMSPELTSLARTPDEIDMQMSRTVDTNGRSAWDDLLAIFLLDRPLRLSNYPIP